ncbi:hypothetical protein [Roseibium sp. Sym1]|uniref:hypothetical protein n=1 Tax=Roseibium sp. Sym1 TaxID=3016006 RepID=UPI0022B2E7B5|nr:hypothetical protein [Roseibium sp. Sym1]
MKIPSIKPCPGLPDIQIGLVDAKLSSDLHENFLGLFRTKYREHSNQEKMTEYFSKFFGLPKFDVTEDEPHSGIVVFSFTITSINNETGIDLLYGSDIGAAFGLVQYLFDAQSVSVSLKGQLIRASTGTVLAEKRVTESVNVRRSFFGRRVPSLPMLEVAAVRLLTSLQQEACL